MQQTPPLGIVVTSKERKTTEVFYVRTDLIMRSEDIDELVKVKQAEVTRQEFTAVCDKYGIEFLHQS